MVKAFDRQQAVTNAGHVVVLMGGHSAEREISLLSGEAVLQSLIRSGVRASKLDVDENIIKKLSALAPDFALNMLHGEGGEDGVIQGFLETVNIPLQRFRCSCLGTCHGQDSREANLASDEPRNTRL